MLQNFCKARCSAQNCEGNAVHRIKASNFLEGYISFMRRFDRVGRVGGPATVPERSMVAVVVGDGGFPELPVMTRARTRGRVKCRTHHHPPPGAV
jgi:hypothetical protein